jgi:hypothetical protein
VTVAGLALAVPTGLSRTETMLLQSGSMALVLALLLGSLYSEPFKQLRRRSSGQ